MRVFFAADRRQFHIGVSGQPPQLPTTNELSELGIDFIKQCLIIDPKARPTVDKLLEHPWIEKFREEIELEYEDEFVHQQTSNPDEKGTSDGRSSLDGSPSLDAEEARGHAHDYAHDRRDEQEEQEELDESDKPDEEE